MIKSKLRISQVKTSLEQKDFEMAKLQSSLLSDVPECTDIVDALKGDRFSLALQLVDEYLNHDSNQLAEYHDVELEALKSQLKALETDIETLTEQKSEQLFLLNEFTTKQSIATGEVVQQILILQTEIEEEKLKQQWLRYEQAEQALKREKNKLETLKKKRQDLEEKLEFIDDTYDEYDDIEEALDDINNDIKKQQKTVKQERKNVEQEKVKSDSASDDTYKQAKQEYEQFNESFQEAKGDKVAQLSEDDKSALKTLFRKAIKLCHPDIVADEFKAQAHELSLQLINARDNGDTQEVSRLLTQLQSGFAFSVASDQLIERDAIKSKIEQLLTKLKELRDEIDALNQNETWLLLTSIDSWDEHFEQQKLELIDYLATLKETKRRLLDERNNENEPDNQKQQARETHEDVSLKDDYWDDEF